MASVQKLRKGLFLIEGEFKHHDLNLPSTLNVDASKIFPDLEVELGKLTSSVVDNLFYLAFEVVSAKLSESLPLPVTLFATNGDEEEKKMDFSTSKWTARWQGTIRRNSACTMCLEIPTRYHECHRRPNMVKLKYNVIVEFSSPVVKKHPLLNLLKDHELTDFAFKVDNQKFKVHRLIISAASPVLSTMLNSNFKEKLDGVVTIVDTEAPIFEKFIFYLYTGLAEFENDVRVANQMFVLANKYEVDCLQDQCVRYISQNIKGEHVLEVLTLLSYYDEAILRNAIKDYMVENYNDVFIQRDFPDIIAKFPAVASEVCSRVAKTSRRM